MVWVLDGGVRTEKFWFMSECTRYNQQAVPRLACKHQVVGGFAGDVVGASRPVLENEPRVLHCSVRWESRSLISSTLLL